MQLVDVRQLNDVNTTCREEIAALRAAGRIVTAERDTANEVIRQIAQMFGIKDVRHILADLGKIERELESFRRNEDDGTAELWADNLRMRTALESATENLILTNGSGEHECCCCGHATRLLESDIQHDPDCPFVEIRAALSHEAVADESREQGAQP